jgi:hypothetical protein
MVLRFNPEEIHLFTEVLRAGTNPDPQRLVRRAGKSGEVRVFNLMRARLLDEILPTVRAPVTCLKAKIPHGVQLIGPPRLDAERRLSVVVAPERDSRVFFVRTAYPLSPAEFRQALLARRAPWPPK